MICCPHFFFTHTQTQITNIYILSLIPLTTSNRSIISPVIVIHMLCRERQASKHKAAANTFKSSHRIFDPDEMLRSSMTQQPTSFATGYQPYQQQQHQQQHQQHQPQSQHFSSTYQPQLQSQLPLQQSYVPQPQLGATTRMESPSASTGQRSTIAARYENRQQSTRQRMQEYGIE